jgi:hypothetical protein
MKSCLVCALTLVCLAVPVGHANDHGLSVQDDIAMVRLDDPSTLTDGATARFSPDSRYFAVVSSRGLLKSDQIESTLSVYSTADCRAFLAERSFSSQPKPRTTVKITGSIHSQRSTAYSAVISDLRWAPGSSALYFTAEESTGDRRLYRFDLNRGRSVPLSPAGYNVERFDFTRETVVFSAWKSIQTDAGSGVGQSDQLNSDARSVTGESLQEILFPQTQPAPVSQTLWFVDAERVQPVPKRVPAAAIRDISWLPEAFSLSPKGHMLVHLRPMTRIESSWVNYEPQKGEGLFRITNHDPGMTAATNVWRLKEYSLVDLVTGNERTLIDAPQSYSLGYDNDTRAVWSANESALLLTNTFLPLDTPDQMERSERLRPCAVAVVRLPAMKSLCVVTISELKKEDATLLPGSLAFGQNEDEATFEVRLVQGSHEQRRYVWTGTEWKNSVSDNAALNTEDDLRVIVKQALNEPPTLWVTDQRTGRSKMLWDPNPGLVKQQLGLASVFRWKDDSGYEWKGGLIKPPDYISGERYPLVLQIYNFNERQFMTDGMMPTAFAARALADVGIVVLQIQRKLPHTFDVAEADAQLKGIESAIDRLSDDGIVDRRRVGLVGFSFSCWYVENALIKAPDRFAAATIADGLDMSYMQYHLSAVSSRSLEREFETTIGTRPFGDGLKAWFALAPGFQLDRIRTPLRIEAIGPTSVLGEWEIYSSLETQNKPVDLIYFPNGQHIHQNPLERFESQQGDVDWFRYWLQDYSDPDPSKQREYMRWQQLKLAR